MNVWLYSVYNLMKNQLFYGDNLEVLQTNIADGSIDLVYIDPPFNSKRNYNQIYNNIGSEDKAQAQAFVDTWTWDRAADKALREILNNERGNLTAQIIHLVEGLSKVLGKSSLFAYILSMTQRINEIWRTMKPTASFYLHCDPTASHYLKLICDALFVPRGGEFRNEIIWHYGQRLMHNKYKFNSKHDLVFFYVKDRNTSICNQIIQEWTKEDIEKARARKVQIDEEGEEYIWDNRAINKGIPAKKQYIKDILKKGKAIDDVWDIPFITSTSKERLGYPTQKPEALLERIILASSNEGDSVLDAYCGCGTTIAVAQRLNRNWVGIDITYQSISLIIKRLEDTFGKENININTKNTNNLQTIKLSGVPQDLKGARALANKEDDRLRKEFEKWAILTYSNNRAIINEKKGADKGIDGIAFMMEGINKTSQVLFSVKSGSVSVKEIRDLRGVIERDKAAIGIFITLEEPTKPMLEEARVAGTHRNSLTGQEFDKLQIITIQQMLDGERLKLPLGLDVVKSAVRDWDYNVQQTELELSRED